MEVKRKCGYYWDCGTCCCGYIADLALAGVVRIRVVPWENFSIMVLMRSIRLSSA